MLRFAFKIALLFALSLSPALLCAATGTSPLPTKVASTVAAAAKEAEAKTENTPAAAQGFKAGDDPYTIRGVKVDVKAENSNQARDKAFMEGGRLAFKELAKRLVTDEGFDASSITDAQIGKMIKSFEVESEKASGVRYTATLTYHFKENETADVLEKRNVAFTADPLNNPKYNGDDEASGAPDVPPMAQRVLVLPIVRVGARAILWEEKTPWHRAWEEAVASGDYPDIILPGFGAEDVSLIGATDALAGMRPPLQKIMAAYQAEGVVVASLLASNAEINNEPNVTIQLARFDGNAILLETHNVNLRSDTSKKTDKWLGLGVKMSVTSLRRSAEKNQGRQKTLQAGVATAPAATQTTVHVAVPFASEDDWASKREMLRQIPGMVRIDITRMNRFRAVAMLSYAGSQPQLESQLKQRLYQLAPPSGPDGALVLTRVGETNTLPPSTPQAVFETTYSQTAPAPSPMPYGAQPAGAPPGHDTPTPQ